LKLTFELYDGRTGYRVHVRLSSSLSCFHRSKNQPHVIKDQIWYTLLLSMASLVRKPFAFPIIFADRMALLGLGQMGHGMAKNIRQKIPEDSILFIYDINTLALEAFAREFGNGSNVRIAVSPVEIARAADIILTSVPQARHVEQVFLHAEAGLLSDAANAGRNILFMELSTIDAAVSSRIASEVESKRFGSFVDAPCSVYSLPFPGRMCRN
jgi:hypothetical protein